MEENHVSFPWGMTIIRERGAAALLRFFLSFFLSTVQNMDEGSYQRGDQRLLVRALLHVLPSIGDEALYLIDSPQTCVTTTSYCL